jgi:hypothetical protein
VGAMLVEGFVRIRVLSVLRCVAGASADPEQGGGEEACVSDVGRAG